MLSASLTPARRLAVAEAAVAERFPGRSRPYALAEPLTEEASGTLLSLLGRAEGPRKVVLTSAPSC